MLQNFFFFLINHETDVGIQSATDFKFKETLKMSLSSIYFLYF